MSYEFGIGYRFARYWSRGANSWWLADSLRWLLSHARRTQIAPLRFALQRGRAGLRASGAI